MGAKKADRRAGRQARRGTRQGRSYTWLWGGTAALVVVLAVLVALAGSRTAQAPSPASSAAEHAPLEVSKGEAGAPVTVVAYADFQCPYCGQLALDVAPVIEREYVESGRVRWLYRPFPFIGEESVLAAQAAACAAEQEQFWTYHDILYRNQQGENQGGFAKPRLKELARQAGLDEAAFNACLDANRYRREAQAARTAGLQAGVRVTPTLLVNGRKIEGLPSVDQLRAAIEQALAAAG